MYGILVSFGWLNPYGGNPLFLKIVRTDDTCYAKTEELMRKSDPDSVWLRSTCNFIKESEFDKIARFVDSCGFWSLPFEKKDCDECIDCNKYTAVGIKESIPHIVALCRSDETHLESLFTKIVILSNYNVELINMIHQSEAENEK